MRVERIGERRPARVKVSFLSDEFEGLVDWVPPARLKTLWAESNSFAESEAQWRKLTELADFDGVTYDAAYTVFRLLIPASVASIGHPKSRRGVLTIANPRRLTEITGLGLDEIAEGSPRIEDADGVHLAWPAAPRVAKAVAAKDPGQIMAEVDREEAQGRYEAAYGALNGDGYAGTTARQAAFYEEFTRPFCETLRAWCGSPAGDVQQELRDLRTEVEWVRTVLDLAVGLLHEAGNERNAWQLHQLVHPEAKRKQFVERIESTRGARMMRLEEIRRALWPGNPPNVKDNIVSWQGRDMVKPSL